MLINILRKFKIKQFKYTGEWVVNQFPNSLQSFLKLARMDKPIGTWLLFYPSAWSLSLSTSLLNNSHYHWEINNHVQASASSLLSLHCNLPDASLLLLFGLGSLAMRNAGCIVNDMWDKDIDANVARTRDRPLASSCLTNRQAISFLALNLGFALCLLLQLNHYTIVLGFLALIPIVVYPLCKRFFAWPQLVLGITFNWGCLMGYSAVLGSLQPVLPIAALSVATIAWTTLYDTIYGHQDKLYDSRLKLKSTALYFEKSPKAFLNTLAITMYSSLLALGPLTDRAMPYYVAILASAIYTFKSHHQLDLNDAASCGKTFVSNKNIGWIMGLGFLLS